MIRPLLVCLAVSALFAAPAEAQRRPSHRPPPPPPPPPVEFGVRGGYDFTDETGAAGAHLRVPLAAPILLVPSADVFFDDPRTPWQVNADLVFRPRGFGGAYAGVGAAFVSRDFDLPDERTTRAGFNLVAGLRGARIQGTDVRPLVEGRWTRVEGFNPFRLSAGIDVPVSRR